MKKILFVLLMSMAVTMPALAADWTGLGMTNIWSDPNNWVPGLPNAGTNAVLNYAGDTTLIDSNVAATCATLYAGWSVSPCSLDMTGGTLNAAGIILGHGTTGIMNLSGGSVAVSGAIVLGNYPSAGASGTLSMSNGTITTGGNMLVGNGATDSGTLTMTGGSITVGGWLTIAETSTAVGTINLDGGVLSVGAAMALKQGGHIAITDGVLITPVVYNAGNGATIGELFDNGYITAFNGEGYLTVDFNNINPGKYTVMAVNPYRASSPNPLDGAYIQPTKNPFVWTNPAPYSTGTIKVDVWKHTSKDVESGTKLVNKQAVNSVSIPAGTLVAGNWYFWRVDSYDSAGPGGTEKFTKGRVWSVYVPTCQDVMNAGLIYTSDISGPTDQPDCKVDFYDLAAFALDWLKCNDPASTGCMNPF